MIAVAFIAFAILVVAWLLAPNGEAVASVAAEPAQPTPATPSLKVGEARA